LIILCASFAVGFLGTLSFGANRKAQLRLAMRGNTVTVKRMEAIKRARIQGRSHYDFEVTGFYPIANK
jgi:hypothetical protein